MGHHPPSISIVRLLFLQLLDLLEPSIQPPSHFTPPTTSKCLSCSSHMKTHSSALLSSLWHILPPFPPSNPRSNPSFHSTSRPFVTDLKTTPPLHCHMHSRVFSLCRSEFHADTHFPQPFTPSGTPTLAPFHSRSHISKHPPTVISSQLMFPSRNHFDPNLRTNCCISCHHCQLPISTLNILYHHQHLKQFSIIDQSLSDEMLAVSASPDVEIREISLEHFVTFCFVLLFLTTYLHQGTLYGIIQ